MDYLPMHLKPNDIYWVAGTGGFTVIESVKHAAIMGDQETGDKFILDYRTQKLSPLEDFMRCGDCGDFLCYCNDKPQQTNTPTTMQTVAVINAMPDGSTVEAFEGVITAIYAPKENQRGENTHGPWIIQNAVLKDDDQNEIAIVFSHPDVEQDPKHVKGKRIRLTSTKGDRGLNGLKIKDSDYKGKVTRSVWVSKVANVELVGPGGAAKKPPTSGASRTGGSGSTAQTTGSRQEQGSAVQGSDSGVDTLDVRVSHWFTVWDGVRPAAEAKGITDLELIKDITTTIWMSFKGQYGVYAPIVTGNGSRPPAHSPADATSSAQRSQDAGSASANGAESGPPEGQNTAEPVATWKDFVHAKSGKKLGEMDMATRIKYAKWAVSKGDSPTWKETEEVAKKFYLHVLTMMAALKLTPVFMVRSTIASHPEMGAGFTEKDVFEWLQASYSVDKIEQLPDDIVHQMLFNDNLVDEIIEFSVGRSGGDDGIPD